MTKVTFEPISGIDQTLSKQSNIKAEVTGLHVDSFFFFRKQIEEQRANARFANSARYELIAWTVTATSRTVREQHHALSACGNAQVALKGYCSRTNLDIARSSSCGLCS